jgi:6-pyruvoyltetrahydropterin/6-carboxytetrahydropterin synthase
MRMELSRDYRFEAAHRLPHVPTDHKCARLHGHGYRVTVTVAGEVDPHLGWLVDFADITAVVEPLVRDRLDHRTLNDVEGLENPTAELLAVWLWERLASRLTGLDSITVHETCTARCTYRGPGR